MARLNVNPTRMELRSLKNRLATAKRGHKLLKDKADEMVRQFMLLIRDNEKIRKEVESSIEKGLQSFLIASAINGPKIIEEAVLIPSSKVEINCLTQNIMSVEVPKINITKSIEKDLLSYSFITVSSDLDKSILSMNFLLPQLIKLAEIEKTCNMLAKEIERNRRRVNALEYVLIPELEETIKYITMKLDERERANIITLMKVKEIIEKDDVK
ncbi:MAG: V-type ATP synthase subunit D [Christensenellales bacterium]|jgi:V/A-type H+-transporting ATPase subunit D|nr:V-type ATP synthase subunit D [Clostridiales bacterium]